MPDVAAFRTRFNLSDKTPEAMLQAHLDAALRRLRQDSGQSSAPAGREAAWDDAVLHAALKTAIPYMHLFAFDAMAPVMRFVENGPAVRFLTPEDTKALADNAEREYQTQLALINPNAAGDKVHAGSFSWMAINNA